MTQAASTSSLPTAMTMSSILTASSLEDAPFVTNGPDFLIVGQAKSGTTYLHKALTDFGCPRSKSYGTSTNLVITGPLTTLLPWLPLQRRN